MFLDISNSDDRFVIYHKKTIIYIQFGHLIIYINDNKPALCIKKPNRSGQVSQLGQTIDNSQWKQSSEFEETNCTCNLDTFWKDDNIW